MEQSNVSNPFNTTEKDEFIVGKSNLNFFVGHPQRIENGVILLCISGEAKITVNLEKEQLSTRKYAFLFTRDIITLSEASPDFCVFYFSFSDNIMAKAAFRLETQFFAYIMKNFIFEAKGKHFQALLWSIDLIKDLYNDKTQKFRYEMIGNHLQNLLWRIYNDHYDKFANRHKRIDLSRQEEILKEFYTLLQENGTKHREVSFYATELCITSRYLSSICNKVRGISAKKLIDAYVIQEIKILLDSTEMSIQEIANELNFPDQSYLGRYFKLHTGSAPTLYRKRKN